MAVAAMGTLGPMEAGAELPPEPGMVRCQAPGCGQWFRRQSGRHAYCKQPGCTYRRGAPPEQPLTLPPEDSAAEELLRRLQEDAEAEVGPTMLVSRFRSLQEAMRAGDREATFGALIDVATTAVWFAERVKRGEMPAPQPPAPQPRRGGERPVGLVAAVVSSHQRTFVLAERRTELTWALIAKRDAIVTATSEEARAEARREYEAAERALNSLEAAWRERGQTLRELEGAAQTMRGPVVVG